MLPLRVPRAAPRNRIRSAHRLRSAEFVRLPQGSETRGLPGVYRMTSLSAENYYPNYLNYSGPCAFSCTRSSANEARLVSGIDDGAFSSPSLPFAPAGLLLSVGPCTRWIHEYFYESGMKRDKSAEAGRGGRNRSSVRVHFDNVTASVHSMHRSSFDLSTWSSDPSIVRGAGEKVTDLVPFRRDLNTAVGHGTEA